MIYKLITSVFILVATVSAPYSAFAAGDAEAGKKVFRRCQACHYVDKELNKTGPHLVNIFGRRAGELESFKKYSKAMIAAGEEGLVWDEETLTEFIKKPKTYIKGTKMAFAGLKKDEQIADVIAYMAGYSE